MKLYDFAQVCDAGLARGHNEDAVFAAESGNLALFAVADGMGGHEDGEVAGRIVVEECAACWEQLCSQRARITAPLAEGLVKSAMEHANARIRGLYGGRICGAAAVVLLLLGGRYTAYHIGDSRIYLSAPFQPLRQITEDHTWENYQLRLGRLSRREIAESPLREQLLQAVGAAEELSPTIRGDVVKRGQVFLLCSDGLYKFTEERALRSAMLDFGKIGGDAPVSELLSRVYRVGAPDNISIILVRLLKNPE